MGVDTFAMSNPALTSILLSKFASSHTEGRKSGPSLSLCFIVLPIVMSRPTIESFDGTNIRTGFLTWLTRHPELTLHLPTQIRATRALTRSALQFGMAYGLFGLTSDGTIAVHNRAIEISEQLSGRDERARMLRIAGRLGEWTRQLPEATVFYSLGVTP